MKSRLRLQYFYNTFPGPYDDEMFFDLDAALITLPKSFNLDHFVNAVCLPNKFGQIVRTQKILRRVDEIYLIDSSGGILFSDTNLSHCNFGK